MAKNKGGRPRVTHQKIHFEVPEEVLERLDQGINKVAVSGIVGKLLAKVAIDGVILASGFWLGNSMNVGIPGGEILQHIGLPNFTDDIDKTVLDLESAEEKLAEAEESNKLADEKFEEFKAKIAAERDACIAKAMGQPPHFRPALVADCQRRYQTLLDNWTPVRTIDLVIPQGHVVRTQAELNKLKFAQGIITMIFVWIISKQFGRIMQGIGGIVPL